MRDPKLDLFEKLYDRYYHMTYRYILSKVKESWSAEDILSEVFLKIYKHKDEITDVDKSSSWIIKITQNSIIDYYRSNKRIDLDSDIDSEMYYENGYDDVLIREEYASITKNLPNDMKNLLVMRYCQDLKFREIAKLMNVSESSAKHKVYYALNIAREIYNHLGQNA